MAQCEYIYLKKQQITFQKRKTQCPHVWKTSYLGKYIIQNSVYIDINSKHS